MAQNAPTPGSPFILKVLSGVHLGAEVELAGGTLTLGRDPMCDIIIEDRLLAEKHLEITRDGAKVQVRVLAPPAAIDGKSVTPGTYSVAPYAVFTVGSTHLAYGERDAAWPALHFPAAIPAESPTPPTAAPTPTPAPAAPPRSTPPAPAWPKWAAAAGVALIVGSLLLAILVWRGRTPQARDSAAELAAVREVLKQFPETANLAATDNGRTIVVSGLVADDATTTSLHHALNYLKIPINFQVTGQEALLENTRTLLPVHELDGSLSLQADGLNALVLLGYVPNRNALAPLLRDLEARLPKTTVLEMRVVVGDETVAQLKQNLQEYFLAPYLQLSVKPENIVLAGTVPKSQAASWQKLQTTWQAQPIAVYLNLAQVSLVDDSHLEQQIFGAPIVAAHSGDVAWVRLGNNRLLHLGSPLSQGWVLDMVSPAGVRVRQGQSTLNFPFVSGNDL